MLVVRHLQLWNGQNKPSLHHNALQKTAVRQNEFTVCRYNPTSAHTGCMFIDPGIVFSRIEPLHKKMLHLLVMKLNYKLRLQQLCCLHACGVFSRLSLTTLTSKTIPLAPFYNKSNQCVAATPVESCRGHPRTPKTRTRRELLRRPLS